MRKGINIIILVNLMFIIAQLRYFSLAIPHAQTHLFMVGFIVSMALYAVSLVIFIKFYNTTNWGKIELIALINVILSMTCIAFLGNGMDIHMGLIGYMGIASILLGGIGIGKNRSKISLSFVVWGFFIFGWTDNWYGVY
ncbi:MAG: hypothetical protein HFE75_13420 [Firmicutes bacterium]|jgi:hypothetical protein|nr:hypothetical protein [Bacillota bacterium]